MKNQHQGAPVVATGQSGNGTSRTQKAGSDRMTDAELDAAIRAAVGPVTTRPTFPAQLATTLQAQRIRCARDADQRRTWKDRVTRALLVLGGVWVSRRERLPDSAPGGRRVRGGG